MTKLGEAAFAEFVQLSDAEQDAIATLMLAEMKSEREWNARFHAKADQLANKAKAALEAYKAGRTEELNLDRL